MNVVSILATAIGLSVNNVLLTNHTGLKIVRIEIGDRKFEDVNGKTETILVSVTPEKHDLKLVFKGGAEVDWPSFDFKGLHQIIFERVKNKIEAQSE